MERELYIIRKRFRRNFNYRLNYSRAEVAIRDVTLNYRKIGILTTKNKESKNSDSPFFFQFHNL